MLESLNFLQVLTLILVAMLFGKDTVLPWIGEKIFGIKRDTHVVDDSSQGDRIENMMEELQMHFNHETTELLTQIRDHVADTNRKLYEFEKYGIPCRGEAKGG